MQISKDQTKNRNKQNGMKQKKHIGQQQRKKAHSGAKRYEKYSHMEFKTDVTDIFAAYRSNYICVVMSRACI